MTIGKRIAALRKKRSWTQAMLSDKMSVSQSTVTMWENGKRAVSSEDTIKLATLFDVTTDYLLGLDDDMPANAVPITAAETVQIPVYGEIQAGVATLAEQNVIGQLDVKKRRRRALWLRQSVRAQGSRRKHEPQNHQWTHGCLLQGHTTGIRRHCGCDDRPRRRDGQTISRNIYRGHV